MDVDASGSPADTDLTLIRVNGALTDAGQREEATLRAVRRRLPLPPGQREAQEWHVSTQAAKGKHASCCACSTRFEDDELRFAKPADARAKTSRYFHGQCMPGGFDPRDTFSGPAGSHPGLQPIVASIFTFYYYEELSIKEISKITNLSPDNVKIKLHRGRNKLYTILKQELIAETL